MNAYVVWIPEERDGYFYGKPPDPWYPIGIYFAETPGKAKWDALVEWIHSRSSGVYHDDWNVTRCRLLEKNIEGERGEIPFGDSRYDHFWELSTERELLV